MSLISSNRNLEDYVNKHTIIDIDGVPRKFLVKKADINTVFGVPDVLLSSRMDIRELATVQDCPSCSSTAIIFPELADTRAEYGEPLRLVANTLGAPVTSFQWKFNGNDILGATLSSLYIPYFMAHNVGEYTVVSECECNIDSSTANVTVSPIRFGPRCDGLFNEVYYYDTASGEYHKGSPTGPLIEDGTYFTSNIRHIVANGFVVGVDFWESGEWPTICYVANPNHPESVAPPTTPTPTPECCALYGYSPVIRPEWGGAFKDIVVSCLEGFGIKTCYYEDTTPPTPPECCSVYGYSPSVLTEWGDNWEDIVVSCAGGFGIKTCYRYVAPPATTTSYCTAETYYNNCEDSISEMGGFNLYLCGDILYTTIAADNPFNGVVYRNGNEYNFVNGSSTSTTPCTTPPPTTPPPTTPPPTTPPATTPPATTPPPTTPPATTPPATTPPATTPPPCISSSTYAPVGDTTHTFYVDINGDIDISYTATSNPLIPIPLVSSGNIPYSVYATDCVLGGSFITVNVGLACAGSSCPTTPPATTPPATTPPATTPPATTPPATTPPA
jgi:hypothetical protein